MGGHEFARQYEWSTGKSQPNCLKYRDTDDEPSKGVVAVDFRAGLALLPFLPMSIGDIKLILKGISRFSLVQFDRGNLKKLEQFIETNRNDFKDMLHMLEDLKKNEQIYRDSIPDITHNHVRLLFSKRLWSTILNSARTGWKVRNQIDDRAEKKLEKNKIRVLFIYILGILPLV